MHATHAPRRLLVIFVVLCALVPGLVVTPPSVQATYAGRNGLLVFGIRVEGNMDLYSVRPNGHALHRLTTDPGFDACAAFSPDGKEIAFCSNRSGAFEIWIMKQNGAGQRQVTRIGGRMIFPDFSPNGTKVVFNGTLAGETESDIFVANVDGSNLARLTTAPGDDQYAAWSPDGRSIVFISARTGSGQVWMMNADGGDQRQLTFDASGKDQVPDWKPDGTRIAYECAPAICVMNPDGSDQVQLTTPTGEAYDFGPAWSPNGNKVAFLHYGRDEGDIFTMRADGTKRTRITRNRKWEGFPDWQSR